MGGREHQVNDTGSPSRRIYLQQGTLASGSAKTEGFSGIRHLEKKIHKVLTEITTSADSWVSFTLVLKTCRVVTIDHSMSSWTFQSALTIPADG